MTRKTIEPFDGMIIGAVAGAVIGARIGMIRDEG